MKTDVIGGEKKEKSNKAKNTRKNKKKRKQCYSCWFSGGDANICTPCDESKEKVQEQMDEATNLCMPCDESKEEGNVLDAANSTDASGGRGAGTTKTHHGPSVREMLKILAENGYNLGDEASFVEVDEIYEVYIL